MRRQRTDAAFTASGQPRKSLARSPWRYTPFTSDDLARCLSGLDVAARALETGDMAKAMVATVLLKPPPLSPEAVAKLARDPTLKKYSPDRPRVPKGRGTDGRIHAKVQTISSGRREDDRR
jgi:hypothetical protein